MSKLKNCMSIFIKTILYRYNNIIFIILTLADSKTVNLQEFHSKFCQHFHLEYNLASYRNN